MSDTNNQIERDDKGRFKKGSESPNKFGRPKGTKGSKHKASKAKLESLLLSEGPEAILKIKEIAEKALLDKDLSTAFKCYVWIGDKYYSVIIHNDKLEIQQARDEEYRAFKERQKQSGQDDEEEYVVEEAAPVIFGQFGS